MVWNSVKTHAAWFVAFALVIGVNRCCFAQATDAPLVDTPSQRWLPPPRAYPTQQENQVKLLSRLRDSLLQSDGTKESNPSRLSDSDVQSLKEAMKQFENYFPEGLTADSLDAIPPDLISKALSNPELVKQARELAEKYSKGNEPKGNEEQQFSDKESVEEKTSGKRKAPLKSSNQKNQAPSKQSDLPSEDQRDKSTPKIDLKGKDFADLMNKLRSTQQTYEQNQKELNNSSSQIQERSAKNPSATNPSGIGTNPPQDLQSPSSLRSEPRSPNQTDPSPPRQNPATNSQQPVAPSASNRQPSTSSRNGEPKQQNNPSNPNPSDVASPGAPRSQANPNQRSPESPLPPGARDSSTSRSNASRSNLENEMRKLANEGRAAKASKNASDPTSSSSDAKTGQNSPPFPPDTAKTGDSKAGNQTGSSMDIRSELQRRGFGPTMQKLVEEAQRASQAARPKTSPASRLETAALPETKTGREGNRKGTENTATTSPKQPPASTSRPTETSPRNQNASSTVSKNMQKTGDYLNKLWTEATKSSAASPKLAAPSSSTARNSTSAPVSLPEAFSIPNPFNAQFLQGILVLAIACVVGFFVLKVKFNKEQVRREALAAQLAPKIDEIQTRDDVVRAFHALAKQRLQAVQAWWTCGHVAERFHENLPEHTQPIRTLSGLYEQARYYPAEHKLTADQIQSAKLALKQCEG